MAASTNSAHGVPRDSNSADIEAVKTDQSAIVAPLPKAGCACKYCKALATYHAVKRLHLVCERPKRPTLVVHYKRRELEPLPSPLSPATRRRVRITLTNHELLAKRRQQLVPKVRDCTGASPDCVDAWVAEQQELQAQKDSRRRHGAFSSSLTSSSPSPSQ